MSYPYLRIVDISSFSYDVLLQFFTDSYFYHTNFLPVIIALSMIAASYIRLEGFIFVRRAASKVVFYSVSA